MKTIEELHEAPLMLSPLADAAWRAITESVPKHLEVYAYLLIRRDDPNMIVDIDLPKQIVSGGRCSVNSSDVIAAGERAAQRGLLVAGSVHRHPGAGASRLSETDKVLLEGMAEELASETAFPIQVTRKARNIVFRVEKSGDLRIQSGQGLKAGVYTAQEVEIHETVKAARIYCLVWSPGGGYEGAAGHVIYDTLIGMPQRDFRYLTKVVVEEPSGRLNIDREKIRRLARRLVKEESFTGYDYARETSPCCAQQ